MSRKLKWLFLALCLSSNATWSASPQEVVKATARVIA